MWLAATGSTGERFEEAKKINLSLLTLGRALNSFSEGKGPRRAMRSPPENIPGLGSLAHRHLPHTPLAYSAPLSPIVIEVQTV